MPIMSSGTCPKIFDICQSDIVEFFFDSRQNDSVKKTMIEKQLMRNSSTFFHTWTFLNVFGSKRIVCGTNSTTNGFTVLLFVLFLAYLYFGT